MLFLEKDLERIIKETPNHLLRERGLEIEGFKRTQVRIGNYGVADLVTAKMNRYTNEERLGITIYELKQDIIDVNAFLQAIGYVKGIFEYIVEFKELDPEINICLIGKKIRTDNFCYLPDVFHNISIYTYDYKYDGVRFKKHISYSLIDRGF